MLREHPDLVEEAGAGHAKLHVCLQETHMDRVGFKVATMIFKSSPSSITVLTMNGSPHCIQLHFLVEQARQLTSYTGPVRHLVVEKGELIEVSSEAVRVARHLASVEKLLTGRVRSV
ncbi:MAG: 4Fe-4S ferredoxin [Thermoprotei archaeon]|nr:MAG: 4Fe-4S ferredoxin [Thermoprotei archaeon]